MLELKSIRSGYGSKTVLSDISVTFKKNEITCIIGPNGCGKSTLLKTAAGILTPDCGQITVDGQNLSKMTRKSAAQKIAYLAQGKSVPDMTVEQLVLHGRFPHQSYPRRYNKQDREITLSAMEAMGISHLSSTPVATLSGGVRQSTFIAMALAQSTDYILLDEPTTYLDIANQLQLTETLVRLAESGKGIITVLHDLALAMKYSKNLIIMNGGKIIMTDTPEVIYNSDVIPHIFGVRLLKHESKNGCSYFYEKSEEQA